MFAAEIDNDLKFVDSTIREYYGLEKLGKVKKKESKAENTASVETVDKIPG